MNRFTVKAGLLLLGALTLGLASCMRGGISTDPPVHLVLDMDFQPKLRPQAESKFEGWADHRASRLPIVDPYDQSSLGRSLVVAQNSLSDPRLAWRDANNQFVTKNPLAANATVINGGKQQTVIERGRERFDIHCAICHGLSGQGGIGPTGHGLVGRRWPVAIPTFHFQSGEGKDNRVAQLPDGELFEVMTYGKGTMPAYGARISAEDRWAIVHYIRALQQLSK